MQSDEGKRAATFLDRDGVFLDVDRGYAHKPNQLEWIAGARRRAFVQ